MDEACRDESWGVTNQQISDFHGHLEYHTTWRVACAERYTAENCGRKWRKSSPSQEYSVEGVGVQVARLVVRCGGWAVSGTVGGTVDGTVKVKPKPRIPVAIELVAPPYTVPEEEKKKKEKEAEHSIACMHIHILMHANLQTDCME